jgi:hypothetical protein
MDSRAERADARGDAVGDDEGRVRGKEGRHLGVVSLKLLERAGDRGVLVRRVLELDDGERQAVDEEDDVRAPGVLFLARGKLVDRQPVVVSGLVPSSLGTVMDRKSSCALPFRISSCPTLLVSPC